MASSFECNLCGGVFDRDPDWSVEDARREYESMFSEPFDPSTVASVCDGCFAVLLVHEGKEAN
jgi:hypothetical protein